MTSTLRPVVAVVGTTGVGKSNLAVSLAQSLPTRSALVNNAPSSSSSPAPPTPQPSSAVVLSADSMQLYKGLDVITNKVTEAEKGGIEHWGLDVVVPGKGGSWELGTWCTEAENKITSLPPTTLPVICGGTHYFIQHFLFPPDELQLSRPKSRTDDPLGLRWTPPRPCPPVPADMDPELKTLLETFWRTDAVFPRRPEPTAEETVRNAKTSRPVANDDHEALSIWRVLEAVDPNEAGRWHWRDTRKVRRGLERWWERGGGEVESVAVEDGKDSGRRAKFRTLIFWVYEPMETLRPRLDGRVDKMVQNGLLQEIQELREIAVRLYGSADAIDHAEGIFQSIGYKEFAELPLPYDGTTNAKQFESMLARTKLSTHQYAKSQIKWIKKQLLPAIREARSHGGDVFVYVVPGGTPGEPIAREILDKFLSGAELPDPATVGHPDAGELLEVLKAADTKVPDTADRQVLNSRKICDVCSEPGKPFSVLSNAWEEHLRSKVHRRHSKHTSISREEWIAQEKAKGLARKAEREALKAAEMAVKAAKEAEEARK